MNIIYDSCYQMKKIKKSNSEINDLINSNKNSKIFYRLKNRYSIFDNTKIIDLI